jgi:hypothetical protein
MRTVTDARRQGRRIVIMFGVAAGQHTEVTRIGEAGTPGKIP